MKLTLSFQFIIYFLTLGLIAQQLQQAQFQDQFQGQSLYAPMQAPYAQQAVGYAEGGGFGDILSSVIPLVGKMAEVGIPLLVKLIGSFAVTP
ncbi:hypothetical protein CONCODRAFT_8053 [Conidiobolus coronatus NRRL 28638]|uniref:Uncharacterized protein n=1 Tax=Conidiobolus coronatus (strain ATCC 28846 / CBS 209.66 / NRRL 28638) TaxID=796925 RepID=A0A137P379_CONC2|nr:hypothetical protein CONCODRAFT_8053 [Conidiobolus coronatus NRRL 28638]|eukprot:KXN69485.1 hypothetical protein CONCODRAFT_8053 [Conidiobolus coronatus NRRL 28638]